MMLKTEKLWPIFATEALRGVAISWLSLFTSVFIYQKMTKIASPRLALAFVFFTFAIFGLAKILGNCLAEELSLKKGLRLPIGLGLGLMVISCLLFNLAIKKIGLVIPAKFVWGFSAGIYWFGWYGLVGKLGTLGEYGRAFGTFSLLSGVASFLAPVVGGLLIDFSGYKALFLAAFCLVILALVFLFTLKGEKTHQDTSVGEVVGLFTTHKRVFLAYFSSGALGVIASSSFILYLALILKKELILGGFFSLSVLLVALIRFFIGKIADWQKRELIVIGSVLSSVVWLGRWLTKNILLLLGLSVVNDLAIGMVGMPLEVLTLEKAVDGRSTGRAVLFREMAISLGDTVSGLVLGILALLGFPLTFGFVLAIPLALMPLLVYTRGD